MTLGDLATGQSGEILGMAIQTGFTLRLMALGFTPRTRVTCLFRAPFGDPTAYRVRRTVICIRKTEAALVLLADPCYNAGKRCGGAACGILRPDSVRPDPQSIRPGSRPGAAGCANHPL